MEIFQTIRLGAVNEPEFGADNIRMLSWEKLTRMKILLIEDEPAIASVIQKGLEKAQYQVTIAPDGVAGLELATQELYSLIILDLMLPRLDGLGVCRQLRERGDPIPILMLTARDAVEDRVIGLTMGADDYLPKPFAFAELLARVQALLRRERKHKGRRIVIEDLEIDTQLRRVVRAGREVELSPHEYSLLEALAAREGQVLTRELIMERVWLDEDSFSNTVDVCVGTLRKKIDAGHLVKLIQTVHRVGYTLRRSSLGTDR